MEKFSELEIRKNMYGFLSRLFIEELDVDTLEKIRNLPNLEETFPKTAEWKEFFTKDAKKLIDEELNVDFTTIFIINAYPYESVFMHDEGHIDPSITNPAFIFYKEHGYEIDLSKTRALAPDHIAVELEFMMFLIDEELKALEKWNIEEVKKIRNIQKKFLEEHLGQWAPVYLLSARDMAETPFYYDLCETTIHFILWDYEMVVERINSTITS